MYYSSQPQYYFVHPAPIMPQPPKQVSSVQTSLYLRKKNSEKLDILYEKCLSKTNQILNEYDGKLKNYLEKKNSIASLKLSSNKENSPQIKEKKLSEEDANQKSLVEKSPITQKENENQNAEESTRNNAEINVDIKNINNGNILTEIVTKTNDHECLTKVEKLINGGELLVKEEKSIKIESPQEEKIGLRLELDELFMKCTKKTRECLENHQLKSEFLSGLQIIQTKFLADGSFYRGYLENGIRKGQGTLYNPLGKEIYRGEWESDYYHGQGLLYFRDEATNNGWSSYEGGFNNGKYDGTGKITLKNGEAFVKTFKDGEEIINKTDRLSTSLNKINEEEEKNSENYEETLDQYFKEEFEMVENGSRDVAESEKVQRLTNDSNENLKELAANLCKPEDNEAIDDYDLEFLV